MSTMVYEGIRVLDFTEMQHGPVASQALGDWGAEVIKIVTVHGVESNL